MKPLVKTSQVLLVVAALSMTFAGCERRAGDQSSGASGTSSSGASGSSGSASKSPGSSGSSDTSGSTGSSSR